MNIFIFTLIILILFYFILKYIANVSTKKVSKSLRVLTFIILILLIILLTFTGKLLLSLPLALLSLALVKLKGLSIFQLIALFRLIQTLRTSGRFSFGQRQNFNSSKLTLEEAYKILNLDIKKRVTKEEVNKAYIKIQKKNTSRCFA